MNKMMTIEELQKQMKENKDKMQNEFIDKLLDQIEHYNDKANRRDYVPTDHEKEVFSKIATIIINMTKWF